MMNPNQSGITRMVRPGVSEEPDVPNEDNRTFEDGRLFPAGVSSHVRHYEPSTIISSQPLEGQGQGYLQGSTVSFQGQGYEAPLGSTPIREGEIGYVPASTSTHQTLTKVETLTRQDADGVLRHMPRGGIQEGVVQENIIQEQTMQRPLDTQPSFGTIPNQQVLASSTIPPQGQMQSQGLNFTAPVTRKDEKEIIKNLPMAGVQQGSIQQGSIVQGSVPQQTMMSGSIPVTSTSTVYNNQAPGTTVTRTEVIKETTVVNESPVGAIGTTRIEDLSQINAVESQYMRDSGVMRSTHSPTYNSRWEAQQFELSNMRHESHQAFENWEANRNRFVNDRLNIMTDLLAGLDRTLDWLDVGVGKVILFFKERESQELEYSKRIKHGLTQVGDHFQNAEHPEVLGNFSRGLKENDAFHAKEKQNCEIMGMFIKKDILDWILYPTEKNHKQQAAALKTPLHSFKKKLDHLASRRQKAYNKYFKTYDHIQKTGKPPKNEDSIFKRQLKYSLASREELRMLRLYDEQGLNVINEFARLESARMQEVQRAYTLYLQKYRELYQNSATAPEPILSLIETSHGPESVPSLFTVKNLLQPQNYQFVRQTLGMPLDVSYEALHPFLINFPDSVDPARTSFVLREWEAIKTGGLLKRPKVCSVIATTNNNLLIIEKKNEEQEMGKVKDPMQLRFTKVEDVTATEDGTVLKVVERAPGTIFQHTTRTRLKFETPDEAQQFVQFVNSQTSGDV